MLLALPFLMVIGVAVPLLAYLGLRRCEPADFSEAAVPKIRAIAVQVCILQTVVAGLAILAVYGVELELAWLSEISPLTLLLAMAALGGVLLMSIFEARKPLGPDDHVRAEMRTISGLDPLWVGVTIYAGFVEEFAYRGVLTLLLGGVLGYWPAAAVSAVLFGLAHLTSGWRAASHGVVFALAMQLIVYVSEGLLLAVAIHTMYDLLAAWLGRRMRESKDVQSAA